jgi:hypothetical protein
VVSTYESTALIINNDEMTDREPRYLPIMTERRLTGFDSSWYMVLELFSCDRESDGSMIARIMSNMLARFITLKTMSAGVALVNTAGGSHPFVYMNHTPPDSKSPIPM